MDPRPPSGSSSNCKSCPNEPLGRPNPMNFHHTQFPHHVSFSQPSHSMNFPHHQYPQQHLYPPHVQYVVVQPQYGPFSLPQPPPSRAMLTPPPPPPPPAGVIPLPLPSSPLPPPPAGVVPLSVSESGTPHSVTGPDEQDIFSVGNDRNAEPDRTSRRLSWTEVENLRLVSAWLNSSRRSNSKKYFWANVVGVYNRNTPKDRKRTLMQLKTHWQRINTKIAHFYDCWCRVEAKHSCIQSEKMQLMDKTWAMYNEEAREMYLEEAKHHFALSHCWKAVWDQPKWKRHVSSLYFKKTELFESEDCTSSSEDAPETETGEQGSVPAKKKHKVNGKVSSPPSELQEDIQCSVDPENMIEKNLKEMTEAELQCSDRELELARSNQLEMKDKEMVISEMQTDLLMADTSRIHEFQHGRDRLMVDTARPNEFQHGSAVREDVPEKKTHPQCHKTLDHAGTVRGDIPEKQTYPRGSKMSNFKRKRKGNASTPPSEVQEDIKRAVDLQAMLQKDREKMSEVQLRLSKEKLEVARLKQQEAKDRKETTLYEKYTELLMADTQRFDEFQKEEHRKAVKCLGEMLFVNNGMPLSSSNLKHM
ncbi:hypothetical protein SETIT_7G287300v2 [Setaria italica]|uniref:No apical meristem-associated C-terminal domain-containing protein n=1 Tax=Setaria italica TaxID=4555 RepID=A0A368S122_SETIT|nr:uncharacterized protein LOC101756428 [Setaria italica]XP_022683726.1 uncharacterized protein LOC101756428 [Setaria italica]XP_022683727.1 uncharacterized protein LOC101756428 [Setaria italica]RCV36032.1 hypothetical protein SETIT_7G287300v2 [Setaria italica]RCV36033.1 hypothetical protein SETIT_7G287300v2 [Setaria italica]